MFNRKTLLISLVLVLLSPWAQATGFDHSPWHSMVKAHVKIINDGRATQADYAAFKRQRGALKAYLASLSKLTQSQFDKLKKPDQLAFLINAYNAWTVELILTEYPDLDSIKDLGGLLSSPWKKDFIPLFDDTVSLDHIEHGLIRGSGRYNDPRIHFAVNCASIGCPALRAEAYTGEQLDLQLEQQTQLFLSDRSRNRLKDNELQVSSIFKWYRDDFASGWRNADSLEAFFALYADALQLPPKAIKELKSGDLEIDFLDYDWRLNDTQ